MECTRAQVKLCDFGSSQLLQHDLSELAFSATLPYMAPELLHPQPSAYLPHAASPHTPSPHAYAYTPPGGHGHGANAHTPPPPPPPPPPGRPPATSSKERHGGGGASTPSQQGSQQRASLGYGYAVDVYSFGVCLWELCFRKYPWHALLEAGDVEGVKQRVGVQGERPCALGASPSLTLLMEACWRQRPAERPTFQLLSQLDLEVVGRGGAPALKLVGGVFARSQDALHDTSGTSAREPVAAVATRC